jgi:FkbM family methyltransferase
MAYYSDNGVDEYIEKLLPDVGLAVDVGSNDGRASSNTLHLEDKGWEVLCIEPNPLHCEAGRKNRKLWRQVAAGAADGFGNYYCIQPFPYGSYSSLDTERKTEDGTIIFEVGIFTLDRLISEAGFDHLDLLSADVEGWEPQVMAGFSVERWRPTVIVLESWKDDLPDIPGYEKVARLGYDNVYVRKIV